MRLAVIQRGEGLPPTDAQIRQLQSLRPDDYHIEDSGSLYAVQRLVERLEALARGDEVCLVSLGALPRSGGAVRLLSDLVSRGVACRTFDPDGQPLLLGQSEANVLKALAVIANDPPSAEDERCSHGGGAATLLTDEERVDIWRLHLSGLSARRIGLIYHRSPKCILQIVGRANEGRIGPRDEASR